jgi:uncharacterized DUF497 family protein
MEFDWDPAKNVSNKRKHDISLEESTAVFDDPGKVGWLCSDAGDDEERFMVVGRVGWRIITVVYTVRGDTYRLISARKASRNERRTYDQGKTYP